MLCLDRALLFGHFSERAPESSCVGFAKSAAAVYRSCLVVLQTAEWRLTGGKEESDFEVVDAAADCHMTIGRVWTFGNCMLWSLVVSVTQSILVSCLLGVPYVVWV